MATALCTQAETVGAGYVHIRLSDSIHQGIIKGTNVTWMRLSSECCQHSFLGQCFSRHNRSSQTVPHEQSFRLNGSGLINLAPSACKYLHTLIVVQSSTLNLAVNRLSIIIILVNGYFNSKTIANLIHALLESINIFTWTQFTKLHVLGCSHAHCIDQYTVVVWEREDRSRERRKILL